VIGSGATAQPQAAGAKAPVAASRASGNSPSAASSSAGPNRAAAVAAKPQASTVRAVAPAPAPAPPTEDDDDPFKALCDVADEMVTAPVEEVPRCPQCRSLMGGGAVLCRHLRIRLPQRQTPDHRGPGTAQVGPAAQRRRKEKSRRSYGARRIIRHGADS